MSFLFSDIEGSTRLVQQLGAKEWGPVLKRHFDILRSAIQRHQGFEVRTEGDSAFVVFSSASGAVNAAVEAQRDLAVERWRHNLKMLVRIGIHSAEDEDGNYVSVDVHRAARIASAAHGGQVLLSEVTRSWAGAGLPNGVGIVDLGKHRLKDLSSEHLSQLVIPGLRSDFPPPRGVDRNPNNLPTQPIRFVGREADLVELNELLRDTRLLNIMGPVGSGKTRLAQQLAANHIDRFADGVWFVPLAPIRYPELVPLKIVHSLSVVRRPGKPPVQSIADWIGQKHMLLLLDNFDQVIPAATVVAELLQACGNLTVVVTSRFPLRIAGEQEYRLPGLGMKGSAGARRTSAGRYPPRSPLT